MATLRNFFVFAVGISVLFGCSGTNKVEQKTEEINPNFISAPGLTTAQIDDLWAVAISKCYDMGYSVAFNDRKTNNLACQTETLNRESIYTMRVRFSDDGILVDVKSNSMANLVFGGMATKNDTKIMKTALEQRLKTIYVGRKKDIGKEKGSASSNTVDILKVQKQLTALNYNPGPVDGIMGSKTRKAIMNFQNDNGITANGKLDAMTLNKLNALSPE